MSRRIRPHAAGQHVDANRHGGRGEAPRPTAHHFHGSPGSQKVRGSIPLGSTPRFGSTRPNSPDLRSRHALRRTLDEKVFGMDGFPQMIATRGRYMFADVDALLDAVRHTAQTAGYL